MGTSWMAIGEFLILDGVVIAWGLWELWSLRRDRQRSAEAHKSDSEDER